MFDKKARVKGCILHPTCNFCTNHRQTYLDELVRLARIAHQMMVVSMLDVLITLHRVPLSMCPYFRAEVRLLW